MGGLIATCSLNGLLPMAEREHYAVGAFAPGYTPMIGPVLLAGQKAASPLIVQISPAEIKRNGITLAQFSRAFYTALYRDGITVPVVLHLDRARDMATIRQAIAAGFTSVMIDASDRPLAENIAISRAAAQYAHAHGVSVEGALGRFGAADAAGPHGPENEPAYTDPFQARRFVYESGVDALAVSLGQAGGHLTQPPGIDFARLCAIRAMTSVSLVLPDASGIPAQMLRRTFRLAGGGISKVNIAMDLELALRQALGRASWMPNGVPNEECCKLDAEELERACAAVERTVAEKIDQMKSRGRAACQGDSLSQISA